MGMMSAVRVWVFAGLCVVALTARAASAQAGSDSAASAAEPGVGEKTPEASAGETKSRRVDRARVRLELTPLVGFQSGKHERTGDFALRSNVDFEIPIVDHLTISPRVIPIMYYNQHRGGDEIVWASGVGIVFRGYSNGPEQRGVFGEVGLHLLGQSARFDGNSGYVNFMEEAGLGYQFKAGWHVAAKVSHISNAGIADHNAGVNNYGIGFGYSFKRD